MTGPNLDLHVLDGLIIQDELESSWYGWSTTDIAQYYEGFSNATVAAVPRRRRRSTTANAWDRYVDVNHAAEAARRAAAHGRKLCVGTGLPA